MRENIVFLAMLGLIMGLIYMGFDFSLILFLATAISGLIWAGYAISRRMKSAVPVADASANATAVPEIVEYAKSFFPILFAIFFLRSFLFEPFRIPSGSMKPTLLEWDFILVEKFAYGIRLPVINKKVMETGTVKRGDVFVFRYPENPSVDYIKRVIGLPGDQIMYTNKNLVIKPACPAAVADKCPEAYMVPRSILEAGGFMDYGRPFDIYTEQLGDVTHKGLVLPGYPDREQEYYHGTNQWTVPEGHYFAMGDNRDNSKDSRFWGFVPDENLKGRAVAVWMHLEFPFSGVFSWIPVPMLFGHLGAIH